MISLLKLRLSRISSVFVFLVLSASGAFADQDPYDRLPRRLDADFQELDRLVEEQRYESAWMYAEERRNGRDEGWYLAKQIELATDYWAHSVKHTTYGFLDLEDNWNLEMVRTRGNHEFVAVNFDPREMTQRAEHVSRPAAETLDYWTGLWYSDAWTVYGTGWLEEPRQIWIHGIQALERARDGGVVSPRSLTALGRFYSLMGNDIDAAESFQEAVAIDSQYREAQFYLASSLGRLERFEEAWPHALEAARAYRDHPQRSVESLLMAFAISLELGDIDRANRLLGEAIAVNPNNPTPYRHRLVLFLNLDLIEEARDVASELFSRQPTNPEVLRGILSDFSAAGHLDVAADLLNLWLDEFSDDQGSSANLLYHLGVAYYGLGDSSAARSSLIEARTTFIEVFSQEYPAIEAIDAMLLELPSE